MNKLITITFLTAGMNLMVPLMCAAQIELKSIVYSADDRVFIMWERSNSNQIFSVFRKRGNGQYISISKTPIVPLRHRADILRVWGPNTDKYLKSYKLKYPEQIHEIFDRKPDFAHFLSIIDWRMAIICGEGIVDSSIVKGMIYQYRIDVNEAGGTSKTFTETEHFKAAKMIILPPKNPRAFNTENGIALYWRTDSLDNLGFSIYRSDKIDGKYQKINKKIIMVGSRKGASSKMSSPCYVDTAVTAGRTYWYKIAGVGLLGDEGSMSVAVSVKAIDITPPPKPKITSIVLKSVKKQNVQIKWSSVSSSDIKGFRVYRYMALNDKAQNVNKKLLKKSITQITDGKPLINRYYWYRVASVDNNNNEALSDPVVFAIH
jgi:hypothetical protein